MRDELGLRINKEKPENENRWYIVRKKVTKQCWLFSGKLKWIKLTKKTRWLFSDVVEWIPLTCSQAGYPRYGIQKPTDIAYFYDDFCASAACLTLKL